MIEQARKQEDEHVPTHAEILQGYEREKEEYTKNLEITLGVIIVLILSFFAIKLWPHDL